MSEKNTQAQAPSRLSDAQIDDCIDRANRKFNGRRQGPSGQQMTSYDDWKHWLAREVESAALATQPTQAQAPSEREAWPVMPPSKGQSPILFEDGYAEGWAKCLAAYQEREAALATQQAGQGEAKISTEHGPWLPSTYGGEEGETYCQRCLLRSKFLGQRKCDPHIVYAPPAPQQPEAMGDPQIAAAFNDWARGHDGSAHVESFRAGARFAERRGTPKQPEALAQQEREAAAWRANVEQRIRIDSAIRAARSSEGGGNV